MSRRANPTLIGGFVIGGAVLAIAAVVVFGSGRLFRDTETFISFFEGSVSGLDVGAPVRFRGIDVGSVQDVLLDLPNVGRDGRDLRIAVIYDVDRQSLESRGATARLDDPFDIDTLMALGIHAELATESLVTGRKYIALDLDPDRPALRAPVPGAPYPEIPTVNTGLERIEDEAYRLIAQLSSVRLDTLVSAATAAFDQVGKLAGSPNVATVMAQLPGTVERLNSAIVELTALVGRVDASLTPMTDGVKQATEQATATLQELDATLANVGVVLEGAAGVLEPQSPVFVQFERAMVDLSDASRALRDLADYLERNPSSLLRGRPGGDR